MLTGPHRNFDSFLGFCLVRIVDRFVVFLVCRRVLLATSIVVVLLAWHRVWKVRSKVDDVDDALTASEEAVCDG